MTSATTNPTGAEAAVPRPARLDAAAEAYASRARLVGMTARAWGLAAGASAGLLAWLLFDLAFTVPAPLRLLALPAIAAAGWTGWRLAGVGRDSTDGAIAALERAAGTRADGRLRGADELAHPDARGAADLRRSAVERGDAAAARPPRPRLARQDAAALRGLRAAAAHRRGRLLRPHGPPAHGAARLDAARLRRRVPLAAARRRARDARGDGPRRLAVVGGVARADARGGRRRPDAAGGAGLARAGRRGGAGAAHARRRELGPGGGRARAERPPLPRAGRRAGRRDARRPRRERPGRQPLGVAPGRPLAADCRWHRDADAAGVHGAAGEDSADPDAGSAFGG